jgi:hypothetical protein
MAEKRPKVTFQLLIPQISDKFVKIAILIFGNVKKKQRPWTLFFEGLGNQKFKLRRYHPQHG